jgi:hypothetical protein
VKKENKLVNNRGIWKGRKKLKVDLEMKWGKAKKESRCKEKKKGEESCPVLSGMNIQQNGVGKCNSRYSVGKEDRCCGPHKGRKIVTAT